MSVRLNMEGQPTQVELEAILDGKLVTRTSFTPRYNPPPPRPIYGVHCLHDYREITLDE
jgi:hypothetical protein